MTYQEELNLQKNAIIKVLNTLKNEIELPDCHRCGMYICDPSVCEQCKKRKERIISNRIPYWENRLQECEQKILKAEGNASSA